MLTVIPLEMCHCEALAAILSNDRVLNAALTRQPLRPVAAGEFLRGCRAWEARKQGVCHVILLDGAPVGTISHSSAGAHTAACGYWLRSSLWNRGHGRAAFRQMLEVIRGLGYRYVTCGRIEKDNMGSLKMWDRYKPVWHDMGDKMNAIIDLATVNPMRMQSITGSG